MAAGAGIAVQRAPRWRPGVSQRRRSSGTTLACHQLEFESDQEQDLVQPVGGLGQPSPGLGADRAGRLAAGVGDRALDDRGP